MELTDGAGIPARFWIYAIVLKCRVFLVRRYKPRVQKG